jgi:gliding motility-associated-like protein
MHRFTFFLSLIFMFIMISGFSDKQKPKITGQNPVSVIEDHSREILISDLVVEYDSGGSSNNLTLEVFNGDHYEVTGVNVTPEPNFTGTLSIPVRVENDGEKSNKYDLEMSVVAENDPPEITGQSSLETNEEEPIALAVSDLNINDPDNNSGDFSLTIYDGSGYTVSGTTINPDNDFNGTLNVPASVNDGTAESVPYNVKIEVNAMNDKPVITGQQVLSTTEETPLNFEKNFFTVADPDNNYPDDFTLTILPGANYVASGLTLIPAVNFTGSLTVPVSVNDGATESDAFNSIVTVNGGDDAPVITGQNPVSTNEDESITLNFADLIVSDPDSPYPTGFTMTVMQNSGYTVSGMTVTPDPDFSGTLNIPVSVNDGSSESNTFSLQLTVVAVNDAPVVTGQNPVSTNEDESITLDFADLIVSDPDNSYPAGFTMTVMENSGYMVSGMTVTPAENFSGTLSIPVSVNDGSLSSNTFNLQLSVVAVNDAPVITGQLPVSTNEDQSFEINFSQLVVSDPDNVYPNGFSLSVSTGDNYSVAGNVVTPVADYIGTLSIPVIVSDGSAASLPFNLQVQVQAVNDSPVITGQTPVSINEDGSFTIEAGNLTVSDADGNYPEGFTLTVFDGPNYVRTGNTIVPSANFVGTLTVPVTVNDGTNNSNTFGFLITVTPVNDAPVITAQVPINIQEDHSYNVTTADLSVSDPDNTYPDGFTVNVDQGVNYTVSGTTITPATDFTGTLSVNVSVNDGQTNSQPFALQISVGNVNDAPIITGQQPAQSNEDQPFVLEFSLLTVTDTDNTYPQGFSMAISAGTNYSAADRTIQPAPNFSGLLTIPVTVNDGINNSNVFNFQLNVLPVNDVPVITGQSPLTIYRNTSLNIEFTSLSVTDVDNAYPNGFSLIVGQGSNYSVAGTTITPTADFTGVLSVPVIVSDGISQSAPFTLSITVVKPPNVKPVIISQAKLTTYENQSLQISLPNLVVTDPDNVYPNDFSLKIYGGAHYIVNHDVIIPEKNYSGPLTVPVTVSDLEVSSDVFNLAIEVLPESDVPLITSQSFLKVVEDDSLVLGFNDLVVSDPDNQYPSGFTLTAFDGENYSLSGLIVKPVANFNGYLSVPVSVNDGANTSSLYQLLIFVEPVNDAPVLSEEKQESIRYIPGNGPISVFETILITDVDDDTLSLAEISIKENFEKGDSLIFDNSASPHGVYDNANGLLLLFGEASVSQYQNVVRSIKYDNKSSASSSGSKVVSVTVSDGKANALPADKIILFDDGDAVLDIPGGFTPNGDGANDTWNIKITEGDNSLEDAIVRIYSKGGALVFEARGFESEWDGRSNGTLLPADIYYYTIYLKNSRTKKRYQGSITLLR